MIKNFQESDFIDAFQDLPIYIGNDQSGEMIFKREYSNGLSLTTYLDIYGEKIELTISYPGSDKRFGWEISQSLSQWLRCPL